MPEIVFICSFQILPEGDVFRLDMVSVQKSLKASEVVKLFDRVRKVVT